MLDLEFWILPREVFLPSIQTRNLKLQILKQQAHQILRTQRSCRHKHFSRLETGSRAGQLSSRTHTIENMRLRRWKLSLIAADGFQFHVDRFADVHRALMMGLEMKGFERQAKVELYWNRMRRRFLKMLLPFRQSRIKHGGIGDLHRLPMVWRSRGGLVTKADDNLRSVLAKNSRQCDA